jgi:acetyl esterase/lipase
VIHGGCWVSTFAALENTAAVADALRDLGIATWNVEYRRLDQEGGGWPGTFADVAAATDYLPILAKKYPLDLSRVVAVGHSAGAHLTLWLAARSRLPARSVLFRESPQRLKAAVAIGGPGDLRNFTTYERDVCHGPVIERLLGGTPESVPERYAQASPIELLPFGVPQVLIIGSEDGAVPPNARNSASDGEIARSSGHRQTGAVAGPPANRKRFCAWAGGMTVTGEQIAAADDQKHEPKGRPANHDWL